MKNRIFSAIQALISCLVINDAEKKMPWLSKIWLGALYIAGALTWCLFFNWGNFSIEYHDWAEVWAPRLQVVRDALLKNTIAFHLSDLAAMRSTNDRIFTVPDMITSPQMILLRFMEVQPYVLVNILLLFTVSCLSLLWFRKRFSLSLASFTYLFLLVNFNGFIVSHLSVGHASWGGYMLLPALAILVFQLLDGDHSWAWVTKTALLLFFIILQGGLHTVVWSAWFLLFLGIVSWKSIVPLMKAGLGATLLSAFRLIPPILQVDSLVETELYGGYPSYRSILYSMIHNIAPADAAPLQHFSSNLGYWEFDIYIGIAGFAFLFVFGGLCLIISAVRQRKFPVLIIPILLMVILSVRTNYYTLVFSQSTLSASERVSTRFIGVPLVIGLILAAIEFQKLLNSERFPLWIKGIAILPAGYIAYDLFQHSESWNVINTAQVLSPMARDLTRITVSNHADPFYFTVLGVGFVITLLSLGGLLYLSFREQKTNRRQTKNGRKDTPPVITIDSGWKRADRRSSEQTAVDAVRKS